MMSVTIIDTNVFLNIVPVNGYDQDKDRIMAELERRVNAREELVLPSVVVFETGRIISQLPDGGARRLVAGRFCKIVRGSINGVAPWVPSGDYPLVNVAAWIDEFVDCATRKKSLVDLSIEKLRDSLSSKTQRRVVIWSNDSDVA